jgi:hypothetical protein
LHYVDDAYGEVRWETTSQFNLKDIDLSSIRIGKGISKAAGASCDAIDPAHYPCDIASLSFTTTNNVPSSSIKHQARFS